MNEPTPFQKELLSKIQDVRAQATREMAMIETSGLPRDDPKNMERESWANKAFTTSTKMEVMLSAIMGAVRKDGEEESPSDGSVDNEDWVNVDAAR